MIQKAILCIHMQLLGDRQCLSSVRRKPDSLVVCSVSARQWSGRANINGHGIGCRGHLQVCGVNCRRWVKVHLESLANSRAQRSMNQRRHFNRGRWPQNAGLLQRETILRNDIRVGIGVHAGE